MIGRLAFDFMIKGTMWTKAIIQSRMFSLRSCSAKCGCLRLTLKDARKGSIQFIVHLMSSCDTQSTE